MDQLKEKFGFGPVICLDEALGSEPALRVGDPGSNPGQGENFSLKLIK